MNRRSLLKLAGMFASLASIDGLQRLGAQGALVTSLKYHAERAGRQVGVFAGAYLKFQSEWASLIAAEFSMIGDGNDLKFSDRLRPTPDTYNFAPADWTLDWAQSHGLLFRGHCLVWWNALPKWFQEYVTPENARRVMTDHITTVVKHYAGRVYSWDVVNEAIYHDNRPDGLRRKPWLDFIGPDYIDIAFHAAAAADPKAHRVLNECYIEHDTPSEIARRASFLALVTRLKRDGVPITSVGIQSHLRGNTPVDEAGMLTFMKKVQDLGLEIMITEFDVDDVGLPAEMIDQVVAQKYRRYVELVGPYASLIAFQQLEDNPSAPRRPDGVVSRPNLFDVKGQRKASYDAVATALKELPALRRPRAY